MSKEEWKMEEAGWWINGSIAVVRESNGRWHSYVTEDDTPKNSPSFKTMQEAMQDAEKRRDENG